MDEQKSKPEQPEEELKLSELLILASMWMLFGFMLWFYLSAFHGAPARIAADQILSYLLAGELDHRDSTGRSTRLQPGRVHLRRRAQRRQSRDPRRPNARFHR